MVSYAEIVEMIFGTRNILFYKNGSRRKSSVIVSYVN